MQLKRKFLKSSLQYEKLLRLNIDLMDSIFNTKLTNREKQVVFQYTLLGGELNKANKELVRSNCNFKTLAVVDEYNKRIRDKGIYIKAKGIETVDPKFMIPKTTNDKKIIHFLFELEVKIG